MSNRSATDTIKGYFYQFDYSIAKILNLPKDSDEIVVEGIEDIDINSSTDETAIQCKYYAKTEYNHSVISKPIRLMLDHFKSVKNGTTPKIKYQLYGHYKSGQSKLTLPISVNFLKENFLTYTSSKIKHEHHTKLGLSDADLQEFISSLKIDINAKEYQLQLTDIISSLSTTFSCDTFDAEYYFYNNALNEIRKIAIEDNISNRKISKRDFIDKINKKKVLFNKWFLELKGLKNYHKELKDQHFRTLNKSPFERFFIIELPIKHNLSEIKEIIQIISKHYSNLSKREPKTFCPYICFPNIKDSDLLLLKDELFKEEFNFIDGKPYSGSKFYTKAIKTEASYSNQLKIKIIKDITEVNELLPSISKTKQVFHFYFKNPLITISDTGIKNVNIQISDLNHIKEII
ncbi:DUF4297 family anti-phage-associated protein [Olleya namhaensis]|uniref:DUF4297 family anti-phage-associated protein n=1 Tax=Olleya namhaensis TaxID=1144750 RepID=UPI002490FF2C|nr:DUF4297 family anti-phage-associated protein [Olleya namhaensis]